MNNEQQNNDTTQSETIPTWQIDKDRTVSAPGSMWDGAEVVYVYTRAQGLEDGTLVDITKQGKEAGFKWPCAVTSGLWADENFLPHAGTFTDSPVLYYYTAYNTG